MVERQASPSAKCRQTYKMEGRLGHQLRKKPAARKDFFVDEETIKKNPHWLCFPEREGFDSNPHYHALRHSWMLVERSYPMVPCAAHTPLPNHRMTKQQRAKIFSIYLRPWTLVHSEADAEKPYIVDLDVVHSERTVTRDMRQAWKSYYCTGVGHPWADQVLFRLWKHSVTSIQPSLLSDIAYWLLLVCAGLESVY